MTVSDSAFGSIDFFTDPSLVPDPHPYFDYLRRQNPVLRLPHHNVVAVTGWEEANAVYKDPETFSNIVALGGPFPPLPFEVEGYFMSRLKRLQVFLNGNFLKKWFRIGIWGF